MSSFHVGYVSIIGRPNVGKSTLLNHLLEQKLSIVNRKPQTTRYNLIGIKTKANYQIIYIDTPGLQKKTKLFLNHYMNKEAIYALNDVDVILFVIEALHWNELDEHVSELLKKNNTKIILLINKIDKVTDKSRLLTFINQISDKLNILEIVLGSAKKGHGLDKLEELIGQNLPEGDVIYPKSLITDRDERFFAAEFLREKLISNLGEELPYRLAITIDMFKEINHIYHIHANIWVEKLGQKAIIIGKKGQVLKHAGRAARKDLEKFYDKKVNLKTWVKVKDKWTNSVQALKQFGYH